MFIRCLQRGHNNCTIPDRSFHDAYVVESYRIDVGKPRQRNIAYLGNVRQIGDAFPGIERELFLLRADSVLEEIPNVSPAERVELMQQLHRRVPPLSTEEMILGFRNTLSWYIDWWRKRGDAPSNDEIRALIESVIEEP